MPSRAALPPSFFTLLAVPDDVDDDPGVPLPLDMPPPGADASPACSLLMVAIFDVLADS